MTYDLPHNACWFLDTDEDSLSCGDIVEFVDFWSGPFFLVRSRKNGHDHKVAAYPRYILKRKGALVPVTQTAELFLRWARSRWRQHMRDNPRALYLFDEWAVLTGATEVAKP